MIAPEGPLKLLDMLHNLNWRLGGCEETSGDQSINDCRQREFRAYTAIYYPT
jgi:hypothetical protein